MKEDENLRKEVELTRKIAEGFRMQGEKAALEEMLNLSSEDELRSIISAAERKYEPEQAPATKAAKTDLRFIWGAVAGIAAAVACMFLLNIPEGNNAEIKGLKRQLSKTTNLKEDLKGVNSLLQDVLLSQKGMNDMLNLKINLLEKFTFHQRELLALLKKEDDQLRGATSGLRFTNKGQENCNPVSFRIAWTPVNKTGNVYLYAGGGNYRTLKPEIEDNDYDLSKGFYLLKNLKENTLYFFVIGTDIKTYVFPFITK
ncbi:MAG: fibronectin type III domain-containing protein [Bacteroidales bacterium]|nr:fibronectin type III domain-containing protein [Bacteroidales bacterium]